MSDILPRHEKEWNAVICDNMNGSWGHSSKWNLSEKAGWILYDLLYLEYKKVELTETESLMEVGEMERYWLKGANFHNKKNKFWGSNAQHGNYR